MHNIDNIILLIACAGNVYVTDQVDQFSWISVISVALTILATLAVLIRNIIRIVQDYKIKHGDVLETVEDITEEIVKGANSVASVLQSEDKNSRSND